MRKYAQMWRISNDIWDLWHSTVDYPQGLRDQFANVAKWAEKAVPGHWPDADMLPFGYLGPAPGWGQPRYTRLTHDEQRTFMTLWCIFPSPLMVGGDLPRADAWTISLLTNPEVIAVDQHSTGNHPVISTDKTVAWVAESAQVGGHYLAIFNLEESSQSVQYSWKDLGLACMENTGCVICGSRKNLGSAESMNVNLPAHGSVLYSVR